jgi:hypothetical protein
MEMCGIDCKLHGGLRALSRRILERDQGAAQNAVLRGAFDIAQALPFVGSEGGDIDTRPTTFLAVLAAFVITVSIAPHL